MINYLKLSVLNPEHSRKFHNLTQCVNFEAFDWTVENMTHAAKKKQRISIEMMQNFSIIKKSVPIVLPGQNVLIGTKHIDRDKTY